jgi:hypothetical protein
VKRARTQAVICAAAPEPPPKLAWLAPTNDPKKNAFQLLAPAWTAAA